MHTLLLFYFARKWPQTRLNTHTYTPVNVPQSAGSSRWRDSAVFSSRTAEEPFLWEVQDGKGGVVKVNKLHKMELWKRFGAPRRVWPSGGGKEKKKGGGGAWRDCDNPEQLLIVVAWIPFTGKKDVWDQPLWGHTHIQQHTNALTNAVSIWSSLPCLKRGFKSLTQIYWHLLRFSRRRVNVVHKRNQCIAWPHLMCLHGEQLFKQPRQYFFLLNS